MQTKVLSIRSVVRRLGKPRMDPSVIAPALEPAYTKNESYQPFLVLYDAKAKQQRPQPWIEHGTSRTCVSKARIIPLDHQGIVVIAYLVRNFQKYITSSRRRHWYSVWQSSLGIRAVRGNGDRYHE